jgi:Iap family predicted aminopeptidase
LADLAIRAIQLSGLKSRAVKRRFAGVDSRSFAQAGIPSITLSWAYQARYHPHRHQPTDTVDRLRLDLVERAATGIMHVLWVLGNTDR